MTFILRQGHVQVRHYPKVASTAISANALLYADGSGAVQPADSTSGNHIGVSLRKVTSADADYAETSKIPVMELTPNMVFEATVTGTLTAAKVGTYMDLSDSLTVNAAATSKNVVLCVGYISATRGLFKITAAADNKNVETT